MSEDALADKIRKRIEYEDELFNSRTTIFLATNGLWAAAVGVSSALPLQVGIGVLGVLVSIMWVMCSWQSSNVIKALTKKRLGLLKGQTEDQAEYQVEKIVQDALWSLRYRPTSILAKWLPVLFLSIWVIFLGWLVWSFF
jgi:hypothetical protein